MDILQRQISLHVLIKHKYVNTVQLLYDNNNLQ